MLIFEVDIKESLLDIVCKDRYDIDIGWPKGDLEWRILKVDQKSGELEKLQKLRSWKAY